MGPSSTSPSADTQPDGDPTGRLLNAAWSEMMKEPAKAAALLYFWLTTVGFARTFGAGIAFGVNVIDLATPSDFLTGGLRDPIVAVLAALAAIFILRLWNKCRFTAPAESRIGGVSRWWRWSACFTILGLLGLTAVGSGLYRRAVIRGPWKGSGPRSSTVVLENGQLCSQRLVLATSEFLVFNEDESDQVVLIARDKVRKIVVVPCAMEPKK